MVSLAAAATPRAHAAADATDTDVAPSCRPSPLSRERGASTLGAAGAADGAAIRGASRARGEGRGAGLPRSPAAPPPNTARMDGAHAASLTCHLPEALEMAIRHELRRGER